MIYSIRGQLVYISDHSVVLEDSSGLCWEMEVSQHTRHNLNSKPGESAQLYTHLHHREDSMCLYGFSQLEEKELFLLLNKVNGIGPKQSIKILGSAQARDLVAAIRNEDEAYLTTLPGIGSKGAKKIILALKDSVSNYPDSDFGSAPSYAVKSDREAHLVQALIDMGFDRKAASKALSRVISSTGPDDEGEILRQTIIELS